MLATQLGGVALAIVLGTNPANVAQESLVNRGEVRKALAFSDVAKSAGISFRFHNGSRGRHDLPEIMGGGVALLDVDGDHRLDVYLCNGGPIEPGSHQIDPPCRLYRNKGQGHFEDITEHAGVPGPSYAMGAATADFDGDGRVDLFVTGWRDQRLYRNRGHGQFQDVTVAAGLSSDLWSTSAAFADLDGDGDQDLYVANYLEFDAGNPSYCAAPDGRRDYCGPKDFPAQPDRLYRNNGNGTFTDVSHMAGIDHVEGRGLGVLITELTGDNRPDIYVANDGTPCWLFANEGNLRFREVAEKAGVARDGQGQALAAMGIAAGDLDGDGHVDLAVTNFFDRTTVAFRAEAKRPGIYSDQSSWLGLAAATGQRLGFGIAIADLDADGRPDVVQANGHVLDRARLGIPFAMPTTLLHNTGGRFVDVARSACPWFERPVLGRGLAVGDIDDDGRPDVVIGTLDSPPGLLRNDATAGKWFRLDLINRSGLPAIGARVRIDVGRKSQAAVVCSGGSYLSAAPPTLYFGLAGAPDVDRIEIEWPWGGREFWTNIDENTRWPLRIMEGSGRTVP